MPTRITREVRAERGQNLTLDQIATFIADAREAGIPGDSFPLAKVRMSGKVHELTVKTDAPRNEGDPPCVIDS